METRGRPPEYNTPQKLRLAVEGYFKDCEEEGVFPDFAGMKRALKLSKRDIDEMTDEKNPACEDYRYIFECARDQRESWLARRMVTEPKAANGCMNALKQEQNGGYMDKSGDKTTPVVKVEISGVGGMHAFD